MKLIARKSTLKGSVRIPASKSHTIRAVAVASLAKGQSTIRCPLISGDTQSAVDCYRALGSEADTSSSQLWKITGIAGKPLPLQDTIDVGNSGTTLRLAMGSAALVDPEKSVTLTGDAQIRSRPVAPLMTALENLGAQCQSLENPGKAPVKITGRLRGGKTAIEAHTSQYLSSLLLCSPPAPNDTEIDVTLLNEPDYVKMTLDWLDKQKIRYENRDMRYFKIKGSQQYKSFDAAICADFSSATFFLCAAALTGEDVTILGLDFADSQPDKAVVDYLKKMGADITISQNTVTVKAAPLKAIDIDMNKTPDALPAMAVTAAFAKGTTRLLNVPQARSKETDRIKCMAEELAKLGIDTEELPDGLIIHPGKPKPALLDGRSDHRIVMALAIAAMTMADESVIETAEAMNVTFPTFVRLMQSLSANIKVEP